MCKLVIDGGHCVDRRNLKNASVRVDTTLSNAVTVLTEPTGEKATWLQRCRLAIEKFVEAQARRMQRREQDICARRDHDEARLTAMKDSQRREMTRGAVDRAAASSAKRDELAERLEKLDLDISIHSPRDGAEPKEMAAWHLKLAETNQENFAREAAKQLRELTAADLEAVPWTKKRVAYEETKHRATLWAGYAEGNRRTYEQLPAHSELLLEREALAVELENAEQQADEDALLRERMLKTGRHPKLQPDDRELIEL